MPHTVCPAIGWRRGALGERVNFLVYVSTYAVPVIVFVIVGNAFLNKQKGFDHFTEGAARGLKVVVGILPTLIGLMVGTGVLRASGALEGLATLLTPIAKRMHFPAALVPLVLVKMVSSSAATSLLLDIFKEYGPDSFEGFLASVIMSSTETIFYTMAVYFASVKIQKTRYTLAGALAATLVGIIASTIIVCLR